MRDLDLDGKSLACVVCVLLSSVAGRVGQLAGSRPSRSVLISEKPSEKLRVSIRNQNKSSPVAGVMPNALWCADMFSLVVYNRMRKLSSCAFVNA